MAYFHAIRRRLCRFQCVVIVALSVWALAYIVWLSTGKDLEVVIKTRFLMTKESMRIEKEVIINYNNNSLLQSKVEGSRMCTQQERKDHIRKMCSTVPNISVDFSKQPCGDLKGTDARGPCMLVDHTNKVAFCEIRKSGSSSGVAMMMKYGPFGRNVPKHFYKGQVHGFELKAKLGLKYETYTDKLVNYTKFMIVRHPFDRLLSSYNDKMRMVDVSDRFKLDRIMIRHTFRQGPTIEGWDSKDFDSLPDLNVTFNEFISMLLYQIPRSIAKDEHWSSYGLICDPCRVRYDYIMRTETLYQDQKQFIQNVYKKPISDIPLLNTYRETDSMKDGNFIPKYLRKYIDFLGAVNISRLVKSYIHDFRLYGYQFGIHSGETMCDIQTASGGHCC